MRAALAWLLLAASVAAGAQLPGGAAPPAAGQPELLPVEQAFRFQVLPRGQVLRVEIYAEQGYYLYRDRLSIAPATAGLELGEPLKPPGVETDDPLFGRVQVYRGRTQVDVPVRARPPGDAPLVLAVTSQGCADLGVCYPPDTRSVVVSMPAASASASPAPSSGGGTDALSRLAAAFGDAGTSGGEFLAVDDAFKVQAVSGGDGTVRVRFEIAEGYYLYRHRMGFAAIAPEPARAGEPSLPEGKLKRDEYFGEQQVYYRQVEAQVPVTGAGAADTVQLKVSYQGCADAGLCYPPQERVLDVAAPGGTLAPLLTRPPPVLSETDQLARSLMSDGLAWVLGTFFVAGLLLSFTPCVLPMIPILSAIIAGQQGAPSARRGFALSLVYVLAMSLTYTVAGVAAGLFGQNLQALFQHPAVLVGFSAVFVVLAMAMFGVYQLQLPVALQTRLTAISHRQRGGSYTGVALMGSLSALIVGPCVAAPLAAALIVIGSTGDPVRGGVALFALSMGMGVPLLAVGIFGPRLLPRAGPWMTLVKHVFGLMLLAVAVYLLSRLLPDGVTLALWAALALATAGVLLRSGRRVSAPAAGGLRRVRLAAGGAALVYGAVLAVGAASGGSDPLRPLDGLTRGPHTPLAFQRVKTLAELDRVFAEAGRAGRAVMLDFYADWCVSCKQMERETFGTAAVREALADTVLVQADVTLYDAEDRAVLERFGLHGPPAILFFGADGRERRALRVIGFMGPREFVPHVARARGAT